MDCLRAAGFLLVLIAHLPGYTATTAKGELWLVSAGLGILIFVSGYVLDLKYGRIRTAREVTGFLRRRVLRIFPLYWVALGTFVVMFSLVGIYHTMDFRPFLPQLASHAAAAQVVLEPRLPAAFTLWYVGDIVLYYGIFVLLARFSTTVPRLVVLSGLLLSGFILLRVFGHLMGDRFFIYFPAFVLGMVVRRASMTLRHWRWNVLLACAMVAAAVAMWPFRGSMSTDAGGSSADPMVGNLLRVAFTLLACLLAFTMANGLTGRLPPGVLRVIRFLAFSSYAAYLFHRPVLALLTVGATHWFAFQGALRGAVITVLGVPLVFGVAFLIQAGENALRNRLDRHPVPSRT